MMKKIISTGLILLLVFTLFSAAVNAETYSTIRRDASGEEVKILQSLLNENGSALTVDGRFGPITEDTVKKYQESKALTVDGIVGPQTWTALLESASIQPVSYDPANYANLTNGSSGEEVKILQSLLNENSAALTMDGQFGPITDEAVKKYQESKGLTIDGIVGPLTWTSLLETYLFTKIVALEAHYNYGYDGYLAVASVIMNRVDSTRFPDTVTKVVSQPGQFSVYTSTRTPIYNDAIRKAVNDALAGARNMPPYVMFFITPDAYEQNVANGGTFSKLDVYTTAYEVVWCFYPADRE